MAIGSREQKGYSNSTRDAAYSEKLYHQRNSVLHTLVHGIDCILIYVMISFNKKSTLDLNITENQREKKRGRGTGDRGEKIKQTRGVYGSR